VEALLDGSPQQRHFFIEDISAVADIRRHAVNMAQWLSFDENREGELAIAVTEVATNIVKHAARGEVLLRPLHMSDIKAVEIVAIDRGPGFADFASSARDGVSTTGTAGTGLGAMRRFADEFDVYSQPGKGSVFYLRIGANKHSRASPFQIGAISVAMRGEEVCGDNWGVRIEGDSAIIAVADGLGHGADAAKASRAVIDALGEAQSLSLARMLEFAHHRARTTRGSALSLVSLCAGSPFVQSVGVGNIATIIYSDGQRRQMLTHNGIVGHNIRKVQEVVSQWSRDALLIMHSDGLATQWNLADYPGLGWRHPALIAAILYRDFNRNSDDVTVIVMRNQCVKNQQID
jgi:anti-sigma regulatory factor (Ser/Thr protein kinase)